MPKIEFTMQTVSPMFLNGANSKTPDILRAASVRGQVRYWFRAIKGASIGSTQRLFEEEAAVFGTTDAGSPVTIRMWIDKEPQTESVPMLPHKQIEEEKAKASAFKEELGNIKLQLITRPGVVFDNDFLKAFTTWQWIGGLGKRSRRTFGAVQHYNWAKSDDHSPAPSAWWNIKFRQLSAIEGELSYSSLLEKHFKWVFKGATYLPEPTTEFPTLHPQKSCIAVCEQEFDTAEDACKSLFVDLLRSNKYAKYKDKGPFGKAVGGDRLASPLHVQVRCLRNGKYHMIFTAMGNTLSEEHQVVLQNFMRDTIKMYNGKIVWGQWVKS